MRAMRAMFAIPGDLDSPTGGYGYARRILREAPACGLALDVVGLPGSFPGGFPSVSDAALAETARLLAALPADQPVLVDGLAFGVLPVEAIRAIPAPVVALCHHPLALETGLAPAQATGLRNSEAAALAEAAHVVTTSHATARILTRDYGVAESRLTVALPGTDPAPRAPGSGGPGCRVLAVGSMTRRKGHHLLIRALAARRDLDWTLRIVGARPDPATEAALADQIVKEGLEDRILLDGPLSTAALTAGYQQADLFALASEYEGFGMAFVEAMAHGLPVVGLESAAVAEATAGAAELVAPSELADTLARLVGDADLRLALADWCWTAAKGFQRWPETAAIVAGALARVMTERTGG